MTLEQTLTTRSFAMQRRNMYQQGCFCKVHKITLLIHVSMSVQSASNDWILDVHSKIVSWGWTSLMSPDGSWDKEKLANTAPWYDFRAVIDGSVIRHATPIAHSSKHVPARLFLCLYIAELKTSGWEPRCSALWGFQSVFKVLPVINVSEVYSISNQLRLIQFRKGTWGKKCRMPL